MKTLLAESMSYFALGGAAKACKGLIEGLAKRGHSGAVVSIENRQKSAAENLKPRGVNGVIEVELGGIKILPPKPDKKCASRAPDQEQDTVLTDHHRCTL